MRALPIADIAPGLRRARLGVFGAFLVNGFLMAIWLVNIPEVRERTGVSHAALGGVILLFGLGSFVSMQITGWLIDAVGSRLSTGLGLVLMLIAVNLPGLATGVVTLGLALFVFGLGNGAVDVAMNHQAVVVEQQYRRPIMSTFHAFFSFGGAGGAVLGAAAQSTKLNLHWTLLAAAGLGTVVAAVSLPGLLPRDAERESEPASAAAEVTPGAVAERGSIRHRVLALALLGFLLMLSEGVANDWSALQAVEHLDTSDAAASLAYGTFATLMTIGRLCADRVSHAFGPTNVVRYGSALAGLGLLVVIVSPVYPLTLIGWGLFGLGMSGIVPQIFTAAGNVGSANPGVTLSRIVGAGYLGLLAGPAVIGWLGGSIGLTLAFLLPLAFCVLGVLLAPNVSGAGADARAASAVEPAVSNPAGS
jgi:MFS family permease